MRKHRGLERRRHVAARVLQKRDEIVGRVTGERVLEIKQSDSRHAFTVRQPEKVFRMVVALDKHSGVSCVAVEKRGDTIRQRARSRVVRADRGQGRAAAGIPLARKRGFLCHQIGVVIPQAVWRGMVMQSEQCVNRGGV